MRRLFPPDRLDPLNQKRHFLFILVVTIGLTLFGLGLIALFCAYTVAPIPHGPEFIAQFTIPEIFFYSGQPAKTAAYDAGCVATPLLLWLSFWISRRWVRHLADQFVDRLIWAGLAGYLLLLLWCAVPLIYCPDPPFWIVPPSWLLLPVHFSYPFFSPARILVLLGAAGLELFLLTSPALRRNTDRVMVLLLTVWALLIPSRFYRPTEINDEPRFIYHLNSVTDSLSQSVNGHHLLVDFPHIYGGYVEMLAPLVRLFPRGIGTLIAALAIPNAVGMLCLLLTARLIIRRPAVLFICGLALLSAGYLSTSIDIFYGYATARILFPPIGLLTATLYFRRTTAVRYAAATGVAAVASVWNLDTGLVLWASWLITLLTVALAARNRPALARHLLIQSLALAGAWSLFLLYLRAVSGRWPDMGLLFYFQKIVLGSGYFCLRLIFLDMWAFVLSIYVIALAVVFCTYALGKVSWRTPATLMITLLGIGVFSYFMGRSAASNLVAVAYPAILLGGIFCAEGEIQMREGKLPGNARFFLLPARIALFWWAFLVVAALPDLLLISARVVRHWNDGDRTPLRANAAFVTQRVRPHEDGVYFLSNHSGFYYYLSDTIRTLRIPGTIELLRARDMDVLVDAIRNHRIGKLFVEENFYEIRMYRPDIYQKLRDAIAQNYRVAEVGPTGRLVLYTPR